MGSSVGGGAAGVQPPCASPVLVSAQDHPPSWHVAPLAPHWPGSTAGPGWHPLTVNAHCPFTLVLWAGFKLLDDVATALKGHARHLGQSRGLETKLASGSPLSSSTTANPPTQSLAAASPRGRHGGAETLVLVVGAHWPHLVSQDLGLDGQQKIEGPLALEELALAKDPCQGEGFWPHQLGHPPLTPCWGSQGRLAGVRPDMRKCRRARTVFHLGGAEGAHPAPPAICPSPSQESCTQQPSPGGPMSEAERFLGPHSAAPRNPQLLETGPPAGLPGHPQESGAGIDSGVDRWGQSLEQLQTQEAKPPS